MSGASSPTLTSCPSCSPSATFRRVPGCAAIPWVGNVQVFAWRTDVMEELGLEAPPATWDDVLAYAQAITEAKSADGLYGIGIRGVAGNPAATSFLPVLRGYGTDLFDENWEPQLETDAAMQAITTQLALAKLAPPGVETVGHPEMGQNMSQGLIAQSADIWPDQLLQIYDPEFSTVVGMVDIGGEPAQEGVEPANMTGNWLLGIPEGSQNVDAALDFILWFTAPEQQKRLLLEQNIPATRISVLEDPEAVETLPFLPGLLAAGAQRGAAAADRALQRGRGDLRPLRRRGDRRSDHRRGSHDPLQPGDSRPHGPRGRPGVIGEVFATLRYPLSRRAGRGDRGGASAATRRSCPSAHGAVAVDMAVETVAREQTEAPTGATPWWERNLAWLLVAPTSSCSSSSPSSPRSRRSSTPSATSGSTAAGCCGRSSVSTTSSAPSTILSSDSRRSRP